MEKIACPGCGTEFIKPLIAADGSWRCLSCRKTFKVAEPTGGSAVESIQTALQTASANLPTLGPAPRQTGYGFWATSAWLLLGAIVLTFISNIIVIDGVIGFEFYWFLFLMLFAFPFVNFGIFYLAFARVATVIDRNYTRLLWKMGLWESEIPPLTGSNLPYILPTAVLGGILIQTSMSAVLEQNEAGAPQDVFYALVSPYINLFLGMGIMCAGFSLSEVRRFVYRMKCAASMFKGHFDFERVTASVRPKIRFAEWIMAVILIFTFWAIFFVLTEEFGFFRRGSGRGILFVYILRVLIVGVVFSLWFLTHDWCELVRVWERAGVFLKNRFGAKDVRGRRKKETGRFFSIFVALSMVGCIIACLLILVHSEERFLTILVPFIGFFVLGWIYCIRQDVGDILLTSADFGKKFTSKRSGIQNYANIVILISALFSILGLCLGFWPILLGRWVEPIIAMSVLSLFLLPPWFCAGVVHDFAETANTLEALNKHLDEKEEQAFSAS